MTVEAAKDNLAKLVRGLEGIKQSPVNPPEKMNEFPFAVTYIGSGRADSGSIGAILGTERHTLIVEIHTARKDLAADINRVNPYITRLLTALRADPDLGGTVDLVEAVTHGGIEPLSWGAETNNHVGLLFNVEILIDNC